MRRNSYIMTEFLEKGRQWRLQSRLAIFSLTDTIHLVSLLLYFSRSPSVWRQVLIDLPQHLSTRYSTCTLPTTMWIMIIVLPVARSQALSGCPLLISNLESECDTKNLLFCETHNYCEFYHRASHLFWQ